MNDVLVNDLKKIPTLLLGYIFLALGMILTMKSGLGMSSWGVLHDGISIVTGYSFGLVTFLLGLIILIFTRLTLNSEIGLGTILNLLTLGFLLDIFKAIITYEPDYYVFQGIMFLCGLFIITFGRSLYISTKMGPGPRDGIFVGLSRVTQKDIKYIKPIVELTVLSIGFLLGGTVGIGTVASMLFSGYLVQFYLNKLGFDAKMKNDVGLKKYFIKKKDTFV